MAKPHKSQSEFRSVTQRAGRPRRTPRPSPFRSVPTQPIPTLPNLQGEQRRWFEREVATFRQLAETERFAGDYVAAQRLERELDVFITEVSTLMRLEKD